MPLIEELENKLQNIELIIEDIKKSPQTYNTILKDSVKNGTYQCILRRKLNNLVNQGVICKTSIPGTRFGKAIFYTIPKNYYILVESGRAGSEVYFFTSFKKINKFYIEIKNYYMLEDGVWFLKKTKKNIFQGKVLKFI